jgi:zinc transport system substrate-binding protein
MFRSLALTVAAVPLLTACGGAVANSGPGVHVVAAFYPYAYLAQRVLGAHGTVTNLTRPGLEPHDLELTPQAVADISTADVVIYEKGFQPSVDEAVQQNPPRQAFDVTTVVPLRSTGVSPEDQPGAPTESLPGDPHLWQDPHLLVPIARRFATALSKADPHNAPDYRANAAALVADLDRLDQDFRIGLAHCRRRDFVTSHAAFGYLAQRYGLTMIPIAGLSPDVEPSAQRIAALQDLIESHGITTVFSEVLGTQRYADALAGDLHVRARVLDPIEGQPQTGPPRGYFSLMRANLSALEEANGCS